MNKPEMHQSDLLKLELCGEDYRRSVLEKERGFAGFRLVCGIGTHDSRTVNLKQKLKTKTDLPLSDVTDAARDCIVKQFGETDVEPEVEQAGAPKAVICQQAIDITVVLATWDYNVFQKPMKPLEVELGVKVELKNYPFDLAGTMDVIDELPLVVGNAVRDCKTSKRTPPSDTADKSEQLSLYSLLYETKYGHPCPELSLDYIVPLKTKVNTPRLITTRTRADQVAILNRLAMAYEATVKGVFVPCSSTHWKCSPTYCEFYNTCRYVNGAKRLTA